jgi:hypothetical protein
MALLVIKCLLRGRAVARPSCVYTVHYNDYDGDDVIGSDAALHYYFEISIFWCPFGFELQILTPSRVGSIGKTLIFGLDSTTNR